MQRRRTRNRRVAHSYILPDADLRLNGLAGQLDGLLTAPSTNGVTQMKINEDSELDELAPWLVLIITLVGGGLRILLLPKNGMWLDETFSVWLASQGVADMLHWVARIDQHPPLYYLLLHFWVTINGAAPYYVRLLSAVFGAATIPVIYLIGKRISGTVVGLAAAALLAFSPFNIYFAQETRMYTLLMFNAAVAIYALVRLLTDPRAVEPTGRQFREYVRAWRRSEPVEADRAREFSYRPTEKDQTGWRAWAARHRWSPIRTIETDLAWVGFIVFSAATLLSHNTAVFFALATNLFVLGLMLYQRLNKSGSQTALRAPSFGNWLKAQVGILLLWSPWILVFVQQVRRVDQAFWIPKPDWDAISVTLRYLSNSLVPAQGLQDIMGWLLGAVLVLGLVYYRKRFSVFVFLAALFAIPFVGELIVSLRRPIFSDRTLIWTTIPLFLVLASGIAQLKSRFVMIVVLGSWSRTTCLRTAIITGSWRKRIGARRRAMSRISPRRTTWCSSTPTSWSSRSTIISRPTKSCIRSRWRSAGCQQICSTTASWNRR